MNDPVALTIIGAGPAGMTAAITAREYDIDTLVLDDQAGPGGQIYRNVETVTAQRPHTARVLGEDYAAGAALVQAFRACGAHYRPRTSVWEMSLAEVGHAPEEARFTLGILCDGAARITPARQVIVATGAQERPVPIPGATLPGVMGAGGIQSLLKDSGFVPDVPTVIAGSGPLVYLVACQLVHAGAPIRAVLLTPPPNRLWRAVGALPQALALPAALRKGIAWRRALTGWGVKVMHVGDLVIGGSRRVESVQFTCRGRRQSMDAELVLLHEGVIPNVHLTLAAQFDHVWDDRQHSFRPAVNRWGETSTRGAWVAGDGARVLGAEAAILSGRIAALEAVYRLGRIDANQRDARARPLRTALERHQRFRTFLDRAFEPSPAVLRPSDPAITVCRCEEVTVAELDRVIAHGCLGPNQAKAFTRCGMGPCQGRMCATIVSALFADRRRTDPGTVGHYRIRPPIKPLTVGELATLEGLDTTAEDDQACLPIGPMRREV